jgi:hypothetical protein
MELVYIYTLFLTFILLGKLIETIGEAGMRIKREYNNPLRGCKVLICIIAIIILGLIGLTAWVIFVFIIVPNYTSQA